MLLHPVFWFSFTYFAIGAVVIALRPGKAKSDKLWIKYASYFLIVNGLLASALFTNWLFQALAICIVLMGAFEIIRPSFAGQKGLWVNAILLYIPVSIGFIGFSFLPAGQVVYVYFLVITFDGFSQLMGVWLGRHKLWVRISPGKTVEGFLGGLFWCVLSSVMIRSWAGLGICTSLLAGSGIAFVALAGDLAASWYKRKAGIKDFGTWIPGHGGVLDRFDSLIPVGCVFYLVFKLLVM